MKHSPSSHLSRRNFLTTTGLAALASVFAKTRTQAGTTILPGTIGVGSGTIEAVPEVLQQNINFEPFMVPTDPLKIPIGCYDGRLPVDINAPVGAKLAGGVVSVHAAFAMCGTAMNDEQTLALFGPNGRLPYIPGCHIDTDHSADGKSAQLKPGTEGTGCGASDKQKTILHNFVTQSDKISPIVQKILGEEFDASIFDSLTHTTKENVPHDARGLAGVLAKRKQAGTVDVLKTGEGHHDANHGHRESYVVINTVQNTTLDNTLLEKAHEHAQAFCVDVWLLKDIAQKLYPDNAVEQKKYLHALVAYQVATYITLANGSQKVAIVSA